MDGCLCRHVLSRGFNGSDLPDNTFTDRTQDEVDWTCDGMVYRRRKRGLNADTVVDWTGILGDRTTLCNRHRDQRVSDRIRRAGFRDTQSESQG